MRKYLLAGTTLALAVAAMPMVAHADDAVKVYLGGRVFESLFIQDATDQNGPAGTGKLQSYNMQSYFRLYPAVDYTSPGGTHYGFKAELRWGGNGGAGVVNRAYLFVKSDTIGQFSWGGLAGAIKTASVANDEASGTGGWDGEYGFFGTRGGVAWLMADTSGDGEEGVRYTTPSFSGLSATVSFMPNGNQGIGTNAVTDRLATGVISGQTKNRFEGVINYAGSFGSTGLSADVAYGTGSPVQDGGRQDMNVFNVGVEATFAGFAVGGNYQSGKFGGGYTALPSGFDTTKAYDAGVVYGANAYQVGAQYYGYEIQTGVGVKEKFSGEALGAKYVLNPGVSLFADVLFGTKKVTGATDVDYTGVGLGTYFQW